MKNNIFLNRIKGVFAVTLMLALLLAACVSPGDGSSTGTPAITPGAEPTAQITVPASPTATTTPTQMATPTMTISPSPTVSSTNNPLPNFSHIFIIVMENKDASQIIDNPSAPYLNQLATQYARAADYYAVTHPSLPNYLALTGGDTFGIKSDCNDCFVSADNLASQLTKAGKTWKAYMESMPSPCYVGDALPLYWQKHDPFIYFDNIRTDPSQCNQIVPFTQFTQDLQANALPDFVWITPNNCNDMHDCSIATGDSWLQTWVPKILASPAWKDNGVLFITFDEGNSNEGCCGYAAGGRVDSLVISPLVQPGFVSNVPYDHYSLLRTIEQAWGLPLLEKAADPATASMIDFFSAPR